MVRVISKTALDAAKLAVWTCLDNLVSSDGIRSLARLATKQLDFCSHATFPAAIGTERHLVRGVLPFPLTWSGFRRDCLVVVRDPLHRNWLRKNCAACRLADDSVFDVGNLCRSLEFRDMAAELLTGSMGIARIKP
jgi:hypothetical protein